MIETEMRKMVPDQELRHLSNEEYLLYRAKEAQVKDPIGAKSWLITAQSLFPKNFGIQFEVYHIEKKAKHVKEAGKCLYTMLEQFSNEAVLWQEIDAIMSDLKNTTDSQPSFLVQLLRTLPKEMQIDMVISAADRSHDTMTHCSLMLLLTSIFPETTALHGLKLVDTLLAAEKQYPCSINPFRRKLVCELLPRLLQARGLKVQPKVLYQLLMRAIEFYVTYITIPSKNLQMNVDNERNIDDPWDQLCNIIRLIGWTLGWEIISDFSTMNNREVILQKIQTFVDGGARLGVHKGDNGEDVREVLYTTLIIFLHALIDYTKRLYPEFSQDGLSGNMPILTLIYAFNKIESEDRQVLLSPTAKRARLSLDDDPSVPLITVSRTSSQSLSNSSSSAGSIVSNSNASIQTMSSGFLSQALITGIKCWDLLNSTEQLRSEFVKVLECLSIERWLTVFNTDRLMFEDRLLDVKKEFEHSLKCAKQTHASSHTKSDILSLNLKLASVYYGLNEFAEACRAALEVMDFIHVLNNGNMTPDLVSSVGPLPRKHLHLLALTKPQCLQFVTTLLVYILRHRIIIDKHIDDTCIGHLLVLLQYEWPKFEHIFEELIEIIKKQNVLVFHKFDSYIINADMLEEFMYLATREGGLLQLDIIPINQTSKHQRTISTRGADRGSKLDFKQGMRRQMLRSDESMEANIIKFLVEEKDLICLNFKR